MELGQAGTDIEIKIHHCGAGKPADGFYRRECNDGRTTLNIDHISIGTQRRRRGLLSPGIGRGEATSSPAFWAAYFRQVETYRRARMP